MARLVCGSLRGAKSYPGLMADSSVRRHGHGEHAIYFATDKNRYVGAIFAR